MPDNLTMNEQLQAQLSQILAQIMVSVGEVKDFSMKELPDIAQQYIAYGIWTSAIYTAICAIIIIICLIIGYKIHIYASKHNENYYFGLMILLAPLLFSVIGLFDNLHSLILALTAPKIWFILEIKNLLS
jgi:hypothetical protein